MFRIGEFSKLTQVSVRMLRYYDEAGLLKPAQVDEWTKHRMYSVDQIPRLNKILYLRDSGFSIFEIARALEMDDDSLFETLEHKRFDIERTIQNEQEKLRKIEIAENEMRGNKGELHYNISIKSIPCYQVLSLRRIVPTYYSEGELWSELSKLAKDRKIEISDCTFSLYHDGEYKEKNVDIELCVLTDKSYEDILPLRSRTIEPVLLMACTMVYGDFSNIKGAYVAFAQWLQQNSKYKMSIPMRQIVHRGPWNESNPSKYLIELQIPLEIR